MSRRILFRSVLFPAVLTGALIAAGGLTGCSSGGLPGGVPGSTTSTSSPAVAGSGGTDGDSSATGSSGKGSSSKTNASGGPSKACTSPGTSIPAGHYSGPVTATLTTDVVLSLPGTSDFEIAGSGKQAMNGSVKIVSNGRTVTGSITLSGLGYSQTGGVAGTAGSGSFIGTISGPATSPVVDGTMSGEWEAWGPVTATSGHANNDVHVGLHVTSAACGAVTGDAIAMFAEMTKPVSDDLTIGGTGTWTAKRH